MDNDVNPDIPNYPLAVRFEYLSHKKNPETIYLQTRLR